MASVDDPDTHPDALRTAFATALSDMYQKEVPLYGTLLEIVRDVDGATIGSEPVRPRHYLERHGAIRLGTDLEMHHIARLFAALGMHPVGYYDLSIIGLPLHATAFRPVGEVALEKNPFRVFTTLLRLDHLPPKTRRITTEILAQRDIFPPRLLRMLTRIEGGETVSPQDGRDLITAALEIFRWHSHSDTSFEQYESLKSVHPILADIACFPNAHINHLTPRTLDIDAVQLAMIRRDLPAKDQIEGPPRRKCPILLRQTSFRAIEENVQFRGPQGSLLPYTHTARFGEIEQRGAALTRKGRELYDDLLTLARQRSNGIPEGSPESQSVLAKTFASFPDTWDELRAQDLVYFKYMPVSDRQNSVAGHERMVLRELVSQGAIDYEPITYEDFLPFSAAGIFLSNVATGLNGNTPRQDASLDGKATLEEALGCAILNEFELYSNMQRSSINNCQRVLGLQEIVMSCHGE